MFRTTLLSALMSSMRWTARYARYEDLEEVEEIVCRSVYEVV